MLYLLRFTSDRLAVIHGLALLMTAALFALWAPAQGRILLVPLTPLAAHRLPMLALAHGALMLDKGPLPGSLLVEGRRDDLALLPSAVLTLSGSGGGCLIGLPA